MLSSENINDDLKVLFLNSGYLTEDETCGYDELLFAVRKEYLLNWLKGVADHEIDEEFMENWLRNEYTSDDAYPLYQQARHDKEIVVEKRVWNARRALFYEVAESLRSNGDYEDKIYIRTFSYDTAKRVFEVEREKLLADEDFFLKDEERHEEIMLEFGSAKIEYENEDGDFYCLYMIQVEVEEEEREYA